MSKLDNTLAQFNLVKEDLTPKAKRLMEKVEAIDEKVRMAKEIDEEESTEESREDYESLLEFLQDAEQDFQDELELIAKSKSAKAKEEEEKSKADADAKAKAEADEKAKKEADEKAKKEADEKARNQTPAPKEEKKKSGFGMFIIGAVVLIATAGVVNVMNKK